MPKRGDFDHEFDGDIESLLEMIDFQFYSDDEKNDTEYKNSIIDIYNNRLDERIRRKNFVIERGVLDIKRTLKGQEKKRNKDEREIYNALKIFTRFNTPDEHEKMVNNILKERKIRELIG